MNRRVTVVKCTLDKLELTTNTAYEANNVEKVECHHVGGRDWVVIAYRRKDAEIQTGPELGSAESVAAPRTEWWHLKPGDVILRDGNHWIVTSVRGQETTDRTPVVKVQVQAPDGRVGATLMRGAHDTANVQFRLSRPDMDRALRHESVDLENYITA